MICDHARITGLHLMYAISFERAVAHALDYPSYPLCERFSQQAADIWDAVNDIPSWDPNRDFSLDDEILF